ncbi:TPA: hypothetical protein I8Y12_001554 [Raoultella planticola]|nr:hypothetical protein [Raoultella planticola]
MRKITAMMSNDIKDAHGDVMHIGILRNMKEQTNNKIIPSYREHDFRNPPIARVVNSFILSKNKNNYLYGEIEFFEINDINKLNPSKDVKNKTIPLHISNGKEVLVSYDKSYIDDDLVDDVEELQSTISEFSNVGCELKKSLEPVSALMIIAMCVGSNFLSGFLSKPGSDFWDLLVSLIKKNKKSKGDKIYHFCFNIDNKLEVMIIFSNPTPEDIFNALNREKKILESFVLEYIKDNPNTVRITFEYCDGAFIHQYSVYKDGTPFDIHDINNYIKIIEAVANRTI